MGSGETIRARDDGGVFLAVVFWECGQGMEDAFVLDGDELGGHCRKLIEVEESRDLGFHLNNGF
jgi:hypothetical protein